MFIRIQIKSLALKFDFLNQISSSHEKSEENDQYIVEWELQILALNRRINLIVSRLLRIEKSSDISENCLTWAYLNRRRL